jgi:hypothetical protein
MAQPASEFDSYDSINFEDLSKIVYNISPTQTPFMQMAPRTKASNVFHEWTIDTLATAAANTAIEGDDYAADAAASATRVGNRCQISKKVALVSLTNEAIDSPADNATMGYQMAKRAKELKRDVEFTLTQNQASVTGSSAAARTAAGLESWLTSNISSGAGGSTAGFSAGNCITPVDGTQRALTETLLKAQIQAAWVSGGEPNVIMVGPKNKAVCSAFAGIATQYKNNDSSPATIIAAADVYVSDFGESRIVPNRFSRDRTLLGIDFDYVAVSYLRPFNSFTLAQTGDAVKRAINVEFTLECRNQAAHLKVADLTTP